MHATGQRWYHRTLYFLLNLLVLKPYGLVSFGYWIDLFLRVVPFKNHRHLSADELPQRWSKLADRSKEVCTRSERRVIPTETQLGMGLGGGLKPPKQNTAPQMT